MLKNSMSACCRYFADYLFAALAIQIRCYRGDFEIVGFKALSILSSNTVAGLNLVLLSFILFGVDGCLGGG
jgi:hypothetical protein